MNKTNVGRFTRISKRAAEKLYNAGELVRLCAVNMSPVNVWGSFADVQRDGYSPVSSDGFNTVVPRCRAFKAVVNCFEYYNCNAETGRYAAFYREV